MSTRKKKKKRSLISVFFLCNFDNIWSLLVNWCWFSDCSFFVWHLSTLQISMCHSKRSTLFIQNNLIFGIHLVFCSIPYSHIFTQTKQKSFPLSSFLFIYFFLRWSVSGKLTNFLWVFLGFSFGLYFLLAWIVRIGFWDRSTSYVISVGTEWDKEVKLVPCISLSVYTSAGEGHCTLYASNESCKLSCI